MGIYALRPPLIANAIFSLSTGLVMALKPVLIGQWLGPNLGGLYAFIGGGLMLFALSLGASAIRPRPLWVLAVSAADLIWILATILILIVWSESFTLLGLALVLGVNFIVGTIALFQLRSIRRAYRSIESGGDEYVVCIAVNVPVDQPSFWKILADLGAIARYMPALKSSALTHGDKPGLGSVRTCENIKGQIWSERCIAWEEGQSFSAEFLADEPGFPYPFAKMAGGWRLHAIKDGCKVEVWWHVVPRRPVLAALLLPVMESAARRGFADVVQRMACAATGAAPESIGAKRLGLPLCAVAC